MSRDRRKQPLIDGLADAFEEASAESESTLRETLRETGVDPDALSEECLALVRSHLGDAVQESPSPAGAVRWRRRLRSWIPVLVPVGAAAVILAFILWGQTQVSAPSNVALMVDQDDLTCLIGSAPREQAMIPVSIRLVSAAGKKLQEISVELDLQRGVVISDDKIPSQGTALAQAEVGGVVFAGVCQVLPGLNLLRLGGPGSPAIADFMHAKSLDDGTSIGLRVLGRLPFLQLGEGSFEDREVEEFRLHEEVSVAHVDDVAVYDGDEIIWSESFEECADGEYPSSGMQSIFPEISSDGLKTQGWVTSSKASGGRRAFLSLSVPGLSRHDGVEINRGKITTGILQYEASVCLNSSDDRGFCIGLKQRVGDRFRRHDKASVRFLFGEIRAGGSESVIAHYIPGMWYRIRVVADLKENSMAMWINGRHVASDIPMVSGEGLEEVRPESTDRQVWEVFDEFSFGGAFYGREPRPTSRPLPYIGDQIYLLEGDQYGWQAAGLHVQRGESVSIRAEGAIYYAGLGDARTDPNGCFLHRSNPCAARFVQHEGYEMPVPGQWMGSLVARIGSGDGFFVGADAEFVALETGDLFLAYNDHFVGDNSGSFRVKIVIQ